MIRPSTFQYAHDADTSVATITLNRPDRLNALTFETYEELRRAFRAINDHLEAHMDLATALQSEAQIQASLMVHPDFREAYEAFRSKRPARFS